MNLDKILWYISLGGIFLLPFVPFVVTGSMYFPFITGKNTLFRILVEFSLGAWLILALRDARYRLNTSWLLWAVVAFVAIIGVANIFGENLMRSFWSNFERMEGYVTLLHFGALFLVVGSAIRQSKWWKYLFQFSIALSAGMAIYALAQGGGRIDGTFGNATYLAGYLLINFFLAIFLLLRHRDPKWVRFAYIAAMIVQVVAIYNTQTRGAILALLGGLGLLALFFIWHEGIRGGWKSHTTSWKASVIAIVGIIVIVAGFFAVKDTNFVQKNNTLRRFANISLTGPDSKARLLVWGMALEGFDEKPVLGWGQENFNRVFAKYYHPNMYDQEPWFDRAHNIVFDWLIAGGILGALAYLALFAAALFLLWQSPEFNFRSRAILTALLAAYFVHNLFVFDNVVSYIYFAFLLGYIHNQATQGGSDKEGPLVSEGAQYIGGALIIVVVLFGVYFFNAKGVLTARAIIDGIREQEGGLQENHEAFERALAYDSYGTQEVRETLAGLTKRLRAGGAPLEIQQQFFDLARTELEKQVTEVPGDARVHLIYGDLLSSFGFYDEALEELRRSLELSPKKQSTMLEIAGILVTQGKVDQALTFAREAYQLQTDNTNAKQIYIITLQQAGELEKAEMLVDELIALNEDDDPQTNFVPIGQLINSYVSLGDVESATEMWRIKIEKEPNNLQAYISYASGLVRQGRREEAMAVLENAADINPEFEERAEQYIEDIESGAL